MPEKKFQRIYDHISRNLNTIKCVSFDVYDTLLHRKIAPPEQVWIPSSRHLATTLHKLGIQVSLKDILKTRRTIEKKLQETKLSSGKDLECHIYDIFSHLLEHYLPGYLVRDELEVILKSEIEAEILTCYRSAGMRKLIQDLRSQGKRIIFISDMYLGLKEISIILNNVGYKNLFDHGYVSSEIGLNKKSGRLFSFALKNEGLLAGEMLHVGDDYLADVLAPKKIGIKTFHLKDEEFDTWAYKHRKLYKL